MTTTIKEGFNDVINGHFVPKVYLRSFTNGEDDKVMCLFKESNQISLTNISKTCSKRFMYTQTDEAGRKDNVVEQAFSDFESTELHNTITAVKDLPYNVIYNGYCGHIPNELKTQVIHAIIVQLTRGLKLKEWLLPTTDNIYHEAYDKDDEWMQEYLPELYHAIKQREPSIIKNTPSNISRWFLEEKNGQLFQFLNTMTCLILHIDDDIEFVTSDEPVLIYNSSRRDVGFMKVPLIDKDTIICYPITPKIAVTLSWGKILSKMYGHDGIIRMCGCVDFIKQLNLGQYHQSMHCVIAKNKLPLEDLKHSFL